STLPLVLSSLSTLTSSNPHSSPLSFFSPRSSPHLSLPSFPTRRSSDLSWTQDGAVSRAGELWDVTLYDLTGRSYGNHAELVGIKIGRAHSELQSRSDLVCRLLLEKKKKKKIKKKNTKIKNKHKIHNEMI